MFSPVISWASQRLCNSCARTDHIYNTAPSPICLPLPPPPTPLHFVWRVCLRNHYSRRCVAGLITQFVSVKDNVPDSKNIILLSGDLNPDLWNPSRPGHRWHDGGLASRAQLHVPYIAGFWLSESLSESSESLRAMHRVSRTSFTLLKHSYLSDS